jgi:Zn-dependent M28 family amino/carboxypeptidase
MSFHRLRLFCVIALIVFIITQGTGGFAQRKPRRARATSQLTVLERNIRAEMNFLASDAMQGRGSATGYERIAAEYIGSQFHQFGLEPAGDVDASGKRVFVQRAALEGLRFIEAPVLRAAWANQTHSWKYGRDFLVSFLRGPKFSGELQIIQDDATAEKGSIALVQLAPNADRQKRQDVIRRARMAQAAAVILPETEANKNLRETGTAALPELPLRVAPDSSAGNDAFAAIALGPDAWRELADMPPGTKVDFSGPTQATGQAATWNVAGMIRGSDPAVASDAIFLSAHLDHLGVGEAVKGDSIYNGADDDASGCVAVLELARALAAGPRPKRTIYFVCFGSEERGGWGARYFAAHSPVALDHVVADINLEMLGRPDAKVAANTLWLTGFERSNLGPELARRGARLVADPHPEQNFFQRSDNYTLAVRGVVAQTVSSFGLHTDYHRVSDEASKIDFAFMTQSINSLIAPVRWLANSTFRPAWEPGKAPGR